MAKIRVQQQREEEAERRRAQRPPATSAADNRAWRPSSSRGSQHTPTRYIPPAQRSSEGPPSTPRGATGGWRERERLKEAAGSRPGTPGRQSPALPDDDRFQSVSRPRPGPSGGAYRPPGARNR